MSTLQAPQGELIKDSDTAHFMADVIETSRTVPVIVDFWAPWCGPCKQLTPIIEKVVTAAGGRVRLVKVNVDENQQLAAQLRVQSIPAVFAFFNGQPVDGFMGALPESQVKQFVDRLSGLGGPGPIEEMLAAGAEALEAGDFQGGEAIFTEVLAAEPENLTAYAGIIQGRLKTGDVDSARQMFASLDADTQGKKEFAGVRAALQLAEQASDAGDVAELRARVEADPADSQARFDLALALAAAGRDEDAAKELLHIVRHDRAWNDDGARKQLVTLFDAWGPTSPLTVQTRKSLSSLLFMIRDWTQLPSTLPVFPLTGALLLPRGALPLNIFEPRYRAMVEDAIKGKRVIGMVQPKAHEAETAEPPVYDIGCAGRLTAFQELEDGRYIITLTGIRRFRIVEELARTTPYRQFRVDYAEFMQDFEPETAASADREYFLKLIRQYVDIQGYNVDWDVIENTDTETLIHASSTLAPWAPNEKQALLEAPDIDRRYQTLIALYEMAIAQARGTGGSLQ